MRATYPSYLRTKVRYLNFDCRINYFISMCLCVLVCVNFGDEILLRGEECKTRENSIFLKNGKTVISIGNHKFSRSRIKKRTSPLNSSHENLIMLLNFIRFRDSRKFTFFVASDVW